MGKTLLFIIPICAIMLFFSPYSAPEKEKITALGVHSSSLPRQNRDSLKKVLSKQDQAIKARLKNLAQGPEEVKNDSLIKMLVKQDALIQATLKKIGSLETTLKKDSLAKAGLIAAEAQKKDAAAKAAAAKAKTLMGKIKQSLKLRANHRANEKKRDDQNTHIYINKDSLKAANKIAALEKDTIPTLNRRIKTLEDTLAKQRTALKTVQANIKAQEDLQKKKHKQDSIIAAKKTEDSLKAIVIAPKPPETKDDASAGPPILSTQAKGRAQVLNELRKLYRGPVTETVSSKKQDSTIVRTLSLKHKAQVWGFYADTSRKKIDNLNFRLISTFVYAINADEAPYSLGSNMAVIDSAKNYGCDIVLCLYTTRSSTSMHYLDDDNDKSILIKKAIEIAKRIKAKGINISFVGLNNAVKEHFVSFINAMYNSCEDDFKTDSIKRVKDHQRLNLSINVPGNDKLWAYNLPELDRFVQYFIIDFTTRPDKPGALAPLSDGTNSSIATCFPIYLNNIKPSTKLILGVPYYGGEWNEQTDVYKHYITFNDVKKHYGDSVSIYNDDQSAVNVHAVDGRAPVNIWYDDEKTLGDKYDYAITNNLGGIAIKNISDDGINGELKDELAYKFGKIDTTIVSIRAKNFKTLLLDFLGHLVTSPCGQNVNPIYSTILLAINIILLVLVAIVALVLFYQVKQNGSSWVYKQKMTYALIGLFVLWTIVCLMWLFFWPGNEFFGPSNHSKHCINISFVVLFVILLAGTAIGAGIYWFYRLNTPEEQP